MESKHVDVSVNFGWLYDIYFAIVYTDTLKAYLDHLFSLL